MAIILRGLDFELVSRAVGYITRRTSFQVVVVEVTLEYHYVVTAFAPAEKGKMLRVGMVCGVTWDYLCAATWEMDAGQQK